MSARPISTNLPSGAIRRSVASTIRPEKASSATVMPRPPEAARNSRSKSALRDDAIRCSGIPMARRMGNFSGLEVA